MNGRCGRGERPGGERSPREYRVEVEWQHTTATTDSAMEQGLEVGDRVINGTALVATWVQGRGSRVGSGSEKHFGVEGERGRHRLNGENGNGCGDATRLSTRGTLWRVRTASSGKATRTAEGCKTGSGRRGRKRLEPHGWKQGAIDLQGFARSKPSESGRTTRAEGVRCLAASGRKQITFRSEELGEDLRS